MVVTFMLTLTLPLNYLLENYLQAWEHLRG